MQSYHKQEPGPVVDQSSVMRRQLATPNENNEEREASRGSGKGCITVQILVVSGHLENAEVIILFSKP